MGSHTLARRTLLRLSAAAALGLAATTLLAACGTAPQATVTQTTATSAAGSPSTSSAPVTTTSATAATTATTAKPAGSAASTASGKPGELHMTTWGTPNSTYNGSVDYFDENVKAFERQHPDIPVNYDPLGAEYETKVLTQVAGGTPPDVVIQGGRDFGQFVSKGTLQDLSDLIARDHYDATDFFPICLQLTTWKNKLYGLPDDLNLLGLYYNKDLLAKAGVTPPPTAWGASDWTWQAFQELARKLTVASGGQTSQFGASLGLDTTTFASVLWAYGGDYLDAGWTKCLMAQPQAISAMQLVQDLVLKDKSILSPADSKKQGGAARFEAGTAAMHVGGAYFSNPASQIIKSFQWDVTALPAGPAGPFSVTGGTQGASWSVTAGSKYRDNAWGLVQWMAGPQSQTVLAQHGWIPGRMSVGLSTYLSSPMLPPSKKVFTDATEHVKAIPLIADWSDIDSAITKQWADLWTGARSAQDVGSAITQQVTALLQQLPADERA